jgi:hypothetical protein
MTRVTLIWREFDLQVTLVGWEKKAESLARLKLGDKIVAVGKCQAGQPHKSKCSDKYDAGLECHSTDSDPMAVASLGTKSAVSTSSEEPEPSDDGDQLTF